MNININVGSNYKYLINSSHKIDILYGGRGSTKTHDTCDYFIHFLLTAKNENAVIFRRYASDTLNTYRYFLQVLARYNISFFKKTISPKVISNIRNNTNIYFLGLDSPETTVKSLPKNTYISWFEEADQGNEEAFLTYFNTLRGEKIPKHILTFNPVSSFNWTKKLLFDNQDFIKNNNISHFHTTVENNKFISEDYKNQLRNLKYIDERRYIIEYLGQWGISNELTYFKNVKLINKNELPKLDNLISFGLDFGFTDPTVFVAIFIKDNNLYVHTLFNETNLVANTFDNKNSVESLVNEKLQDILGEHKNKLFFNIFCDGSRPEIIEILNNSKQLTNIKFVSADKSGGSILVGINKLKYFNNIFVTNENDLEAFLNYSKEKTKNGIILETPQNNQNDHVVDSTRYALSYFTFYN